MKRIAFNFIYAFNFYIIFNGIKTIIQNLGIGYSDT